MRTTRILIWIAYWLTALGWPFAFLAGLITFAGGGFFIWVAYYTLWQWIKDLREDHMALERTHDPKRSLRENVTKETDWMLARTRDAHPSAIVRHHDGTQDIGNVNGFQDLGYAPSWVDVRGAYPIQMQCQDCSARFEPPYPEECPYCGHRVFARPSAP